MASAPVFAKTSHASHRPRVLPTCTALAVAVSTLSGCSSVMVGHRSTSEALLQQRTTIVTGSRLSSDTQSRLLQSGLNADKCLANMPSCLVRLQKASLSGDKGIYGAASELFFAAAKQREDGLQCTEQPSGLNSDFAKQLVQPVSTDAKNIDTAALDTPPTTDPASTSNSPIDAHTNTKKELSCQAAAQDDMLQAARFAYIYLMYDYLPKPANFVDHDPYSPYAVADGSLENDVITVLGDSSLDNPLDVDSQSSIDNNNNNTNPNPSSNTTANIAAANTKPLLYPPNERDIQIKDLYYAAIDNLGDRLAKQRLRGEYRINANRIHVLLNQQPVSSGKSAIQLISSYQLNLSGFNSISRRDGLGVNYVGLFDDRYTSSLRDQIINGKPTNLPLAERIHPAGHIALTALLVPQGNDLASLLSTNQFELQLYDPTLFNSATLQDKPFALSANFSAAYGLWLNDNSLEPLSLLTLFSKKHQETQPQLFMLEPYNPNKRVIIMLHGLGSSPVTWIGLTNDIFNDPKLRDNYQVWQVFYPTNIPILENRYQINALLRKAFEQVDPTGQSAASQHGVIIGHSMGGVIGRMLVSNTDLTPSLANLLKTYNGGLDNSSSYRQLARMASDQTFADRFTLHALPQIDRAVFISSPFRGTTYADKWFTRSLRRIISLPKSFLQAATYSLNTVLDGQPSEGNPLSGLFLENGASQLSDKSFFVKLTQDVQPAANIKINTLIATDDNDLFNALLNDPSNSPKPPTSDSTVTPTPTAVATDTPAANTGTSTNSATATTSLYNPTNLQQAKQSVELNQQLLEQVAQGASDYLSDGIVPYRSAHLDQVESEKILVGKHNVHTSPQAILELRRILHRQLNLTGLPSDQANKTPDKQP